MLEVEVELTEGDVFRAHLWTLFQLSGVRLLLAVNLLFLLLAVVFFVSAMLREELTWTLGSALVVPAFFVTAFALQVRRGARRRFRSLSPEERRGTYRFDEEGFEWSLGRASGKLPWSAVSNRAETDRAFYLMTPAARTHVIPKRRMSAESREALRSLPFR